VSKKKIVIIEDEPDILEVLSYNLKREGYEIHTASDGIRGLALVRQQVPDLVLLDLMLPGMDGVEICSSIKKDPQTQGTLIIMVTAKGEESDIVLGLGVGADDYISKPFTPRELVARVKAVLRRVQGEPDSGAVLRAGHAELDPTSRTCSLDGEDVELTRLEFDLLAELAAHPNVVFTRERLLERVWGYQSGVGGKTVDVHVANLRRKLGKDLPIVAVRGVGYRLDPPGS